MLRLKNLSFILLFLSFFVPGKGNSQIGIQSHYHLPGLIGETSAVPIPVLNSGWSAGLIYSFRSSGIRLEWVPGLSYVQMKGETLDQKITGQGGIASLDFRMYPMDLYGDCKCPTFSRKGDVFKKGFFWEAGLGAQMMKIDLQEQENNHLSYFARVGAGLDIGLSRRVTFTPGLRFQYHYGLHAWGDSGSEKNHRPFWFLPFVQIMTYFQD